MRIQNKALPFLGALLLVQAALAVTPNLKENYQPIIDRNPFGLKPPPPPPTNAPPVAPPVEKPKMDIFMTGIVTVGYPKYPKKVYLKTQAQGPKKEEKLLDLREGDESDGIKVLSIDEINKKVKIQTDSGETLLTFQTHGVAPPIAAAPMPFPGQPGVPGQVMPGQPGAMPTPLPNANPQVGYVNPAANVPQAYPANQPGAVNVPLNGAQANYRAIPSRTVRSRVPDVLQGNPGLQGGAPQGAQEQMDPAEQYLRMHLDKATKERQGVPMPPLPPI
jgi:hypothetical protein